MVSSSFSSSSDYIKNFSGRGKNTRVLMSETRLNATRTILMGSFVKNVKKDDFIFNFLSKHGCCSQEYKSRKIHRNLVNPEVIIAPTKTIFRGNGIEHRSNRSQSRSQESPSVSLFPGLQQLVRFSLLVS